jgi:protein arginine kinase activator
MNPCHFCGQPATIHYTSLIGKKKVEQHLCEKCARAKGVVSEGPIASAPLDLQALVQLVLGQHAAADTKGLRCPECGLKYTQFRAEGRFGCPHDYDAFGGVLTPLLERIHRATAHAGKVPRRAAGRTELADLRRELDDAVRGERYEDAARLRDLIRQREGADGPR